MKKLRLLVLVHKTLVPPDTLEGHSEEEIDEWRIGFEVLQALRKMGHEAQPLGLSDELGELRRQLDEWKPQVAFNLLEEFHSIAAYDQHIVAYLELMRQPYTGCNPRGLLLSRDKVLAKHVLAYHRIRSPRFAVFPCGRKFRPTSQLQYPLFVKSATEDASLAIAQASIVRDKDQLKDRVAFVHEQTQSDALVEEFIDGRELYVGMLGNERLLCFPVWELTFSKAPEEVARIATRKVKWDRRYQEKHGVTTHPAKDLAPEVQSRIHRLCKRIYRALHLSGYARMDFRLREDGEIYFLEANANPNLAGDEDFARSAKEIGISYPDLLQRIVSLGLNYRAEWRG
ncbi:MAG: D-alanine--D-alanine ligase [Planctomycetia bacterium]|nr:D-alanine--D-alanine ligase [Planctomycetia bacterium]